jgi:hypothetical protein
MIHERHVGHACGHDHRLCREPLPRRRFLVGAGVFMAASVVPGGLKEFAPDGIVGELKRLHYDTANATSAPAIAALLKLVPTSQITYGTDYPYFPLDQIASLRQMGFNPDEMYAIESGNAIQLIPRLKA